jgi:signal transduction histidine kinase
MHTWSRPRGRDTFAYELELATAAHDLRNRVSVAGCEIRQLHRRLGACDATVSVSLESIEGSLAHTNALLEALLELACTQANLPLGIDPRRVDLVRVARRLVTLHVGSGNTHRIALVARVPQLMGAWNYANLRHLLRILLTNAVRYSPAGGDVIVTVEQQPDEALLRVADHGIGIPAADLPHMFEPFFRARNAERITPGIGLGLATARLIVEQYGGALDVESTEGVGTTFTAHLPLASLPLRR